MYIHVANERRRVMQVQVSKWGNSLGVRLPKALAAQVGVADGQRVEVSVEGGRLVITPVKGGYCLADLLANMSPDAMRSAFDWGEDRGRERLDD